MKCVRYTLISSEGAFSSERGKHWRGSAGGYEMGRYSLSIIYPGGQACPWLLRRVRDPVLSAVRAWCCDRASVGRFLDSLRDVHVGVGQCVRRRAPASGGAHTTGTDCVSSRAAAVGAIGTSFGRGGGCRLLCVTEPLRSAFSGWKAHHALQSPSCELDIVWLL